MPLLTEGEITFSNIVHIGEMKTPYCQKIYTDIPQCCGGGDFDQVSIEGVARALGRGSSLAFMWSLSLRMVVGLIYFHKCEGGFVLFKLSSGSGKNRIYLILL